MSDLPNADVLRAFFDGFANGDAAAMNACYAPDVAFEDPVFGPLAGERPRAMWTMLCMALKDFSLTFEILRADEREGEVRWIAAYTYSPTGKRVRNVVHSTFAFRDGKIAKQTDVFDLWRWSAQALGPIGIVLGWSPIVRNRIRATATERLAKFEVARVARTFVNIDFE